MKRWISALVLVAALLPAPAEASRKSSDPTNVANYLQATSTATAGSSWTVAMWIQRTADGVNSALFGNETNGPLISITASANLLKAFNPGYTGQVDSVTAITGTAWHWIAVVYNFGAPTFTLYIDSPTVANASGATGTSSLLSAASPFTIGLDAANAWPSNAKFALVVVFKADETANLAAIKASATPHTVDSANAIGAWYMCGIAGSLTDQSASAHDMAVNGTFGTDADDPTSCPSPATPKTLLKLKN